MPAYTASELFASTAPHYVFTVRDGNCPLGANTN
jgi:hypothetical protein